MAIGYTEIDFLNGSAPALNATNLNKIDEAIKDACDLLDAETVAGRALVEADNADAQRTLLNVEDGADVTANNAPKAHTASHKHGGTDEIATATPAPNAIPKADGSSKLDGWISAAASGTAGKIALATAAEMETGTESGKALTPATVRNVTTKRTRMPDGDASPKYVGSFASTDSWDAQGQGTLSVSNGSLILTLSTTMTSALYRSITSFEGGGKSLCFKITSTSTATLQIGYTLAGSNVYKNITNGSSDRVILPLGAITSIRILQSTAASGTVITVSYCWIGDYSYLQGSLSEEAARVWSEAADALGVGVAASASLTFSSNANNGDTVTIGGKVITFRDAAYWAGGSVEGDVLIGATTTETANNFRWGLNRYSYGTNNGLIYKFAAVNPLVFGQGGGAGIVVLTHGTASSDGAQVFSPKTGEIGNNITLAESTSGARIVISGPTLTGGVSAGAAKIKTLNNAALGYVPAATPNKTATTSIGYFAVADCASGAQVTLPAGGTWAWEVTTYGATYNSVKSGTAAGGAAISGTASANLCMRYERVA